MLVDSFELRSAIFADLAAMAAETDGTVSRAQLLDYKIQGHRLPLIDAQGRGIRNPESLEYTLSVTTSEGKRYVEREVEPGVWTYSYCINKRGAVDASNRKLELACRDGVPVIYLYKPAPQTYLPVALATVTKADRTSRQFELSLLHDGVRLGHDSSSLERAWARRMVSQRLHQPRFRKLVLSAYGSRCAVCALPESALVDAAHIRADNDPANGQPVVENGLALCAIHHRAYDTRRLGIDGDYVVHTAPRILDIVDGPVLRSALQQVDGQPLGVLPPRGQRPDPYRLELTFKEFLSVSA